MLKSFLLQDADGAMKAFPVEEVLAGKHDAILRFPKSYLSMVADERPWDGKPHVTDLLNGPRVTWLRANYDYAVNPDDAAYRVLGIQAHAALEGGEYSEVPLDDGEVQGRTDLLEPNGDGTFTMTDYKVVGSYKIAKAIGIYTAKEPSLDEAGNQVFYKSGAKAGQLKTHNVLKVDTSKQDKKDWTRQLNIYRLLAQEKLQINVTKLQIFAIARDGGTIAATTRGVNQKTYLIPIDIFTEEVVSKFMTSRITELAEAFKNNACPRLCTAEESWDGRRCAEFCEVADACRLHGGPFQFKPDPEAEE